jgi:hypothetical protein
MSPLLYQLSYRPGHLIMRSGPDRLPTSTLSSVAVDPIARFREIVALWNARDYETFLEAWTDESVFVPDPKWPEQGPFVGDDGRRQLVEFADAWEQVELQIDSLELVDDVVLGDVRWVVTGAASGADVPVDFWMVTRFDDRGNIRSFHAFFDEEPARAETERG